MKDGNGPCAGACLRARSRCLAGVEGREHEVAQSAGNLADLLWLRLLAGPARSANGHGPLSMTGWLFSRKSLCFISDSLGAVEGFSGASSSASSSAPRSPVSRITCRKVSSTAVLKPSHAPRCSSTSSAISSSRSLSNETITGAHPGQESLPGGDNLLACLWGDRLARVVELRPGGQAPHAVLRGMPVARN